MVVKNTLLHKALESLEEAFSPLYDSLKGTTAITVSYTHLDVYKRQEVFYATGIRLSELIGLDDKDVDFSAFLLNKCLQLL